MRRVGAIDVLRACACRIQHRLSHDAHMLTQSFHAAHQCGHCPRVQRLRAGGVGFGGAVSDKASDRVDRVPGAVYVVEVREGNRDVFGICVDGLEGFRKGVGLHEFPPTMWKSRCPASKWGGRAQDKVGRPDRRNRRTTSAPLSWPAHRTCEGVLTGKSTPTNLPAFTPGYRWRR